MTRSGCALTALLVGCLVGCATKDPLAYESTRELREAVVRSQRNQLRAAEKAEPREVKQAPSDSYLYEGEQRQQRVDQLDAISGRAELSKTSLDTRTGLDGQPSATAAVSLERAVKVAVENSLPIMQARLLPAISETQIVEAEAVFDAVFFSDFTYTGTDRPRAGTLLGNQTVGTDTTVSNATSLTTGIRQPLQTGGQVEVSTGFDYSKNETEGLTLVPDPAFTTNILVNVQQPLLRNFGTQINRSQIRINRNAHRRDLLTLHAQMLSTIAQVEQAYWNVYLARYQLAIQQKLFDLTVETKDKIYVRFKTFDATPVQMSQAQAFVEQRKGDVVRARRAVRSASDQLKALIYDPQMPLTDETLIVPLDEPVELPVRYSLLDAVTTALQKRPEMRAALLEIDDASIRSALADNQRLPVLNLTAQAQYFGLDNDLGTSIGNSVDGDFISYLVGFQFEAPLGNRAAEANYREARLGRKLAVMRYQQSVQEIVLSVKEAIRDIDEAWRLIAVNRDARRAAAENLRVLQERDKEGEAQTPEFLLDLMLNAQQRLADAELREVGSIVEYNVALARLHQTTGTLLEHNRIELTWPDGMFDEIGNGASQRDDAGRDPGPAPDPDMLEAPRN